MDADLNQPFYETSFPVTVTGGDVFGELLRENISFKATRAGPVTLTVWLARPQADQSILKRTEPMLVVDPNPAPLTGTIACIDGDGKLIPALKRQFGVNAVSLAATTGPVDVMLACSSSLPHSKKPVPTFDWSRVLPGALERVRAGSRLILLGVDGQDMGAAAKVLAAQGVLNYLGTAGFDDTPWVGHWYFAKKHWLLDGLPSNCVLDWQYQAAGGGDGLVMDAPGLEAVIGYGKNPGPGLGLGAAVVPYGKGEIVLLTIPGLNSGFVDANAKVFQPITARRIIYNALHGPESSGLARAERK
jgi:hypothetical protein